MKRIVLLVAFAAALLAQDHPDLSGTWVWNLAKSNFDRQPQYQAHTDRIEQSDPDLAFHATMTTAQGTTRSTLRYKTDGSEVTNIVHGNPLKATAKWEGKVLVIETWGKFGDNEMRLKDRYSLSRDAKTLILNRHYEGRGGAQDQTIVLDRKD